MDLVRFSIALSVFLCYGTPPSQGQAIVSIKDSCEAKSAPWIPCEKFDYVKNATGSGIKCWIFCSRSGFYSKTGRFIRCIQGDPEAKYIKSCRRQIEKRGKEKMREGTRGKRKTSEPKEEGVRAKTDFTPDESRRLNNLTKVFRKVEDKDLNDFKKFILEKGLETKIKLANDGKISFRDPDCGENKDYPCHRIHQIIEGVNENIDYINEILSLKKMKEELRLRERESEEGEFPGLLNTTNRRGFLLHYPVELGNWSRLEDPSQIKCPSHHKDMLSNPRRLGKYNLDIIVRRPRIGTFETVVPGYICQGMQWTSTCNEMWYFVTYHDRAVHYITPNKLKCLQNIRAHKRGEHIKPYYPLEECNWNSETTKTVDYFMITPYSPEVDPFTLEFKSEIFPDRTSCRPGDEICVTDDDSKVWFPDEDDKLIARGHCPDETWDESHLTIHPEEMPENWEDPQSPWVSDYILKGVLFGEKRVKKSCLLEFCGTSGLLFEDGEWWELNVFSREKGRESLTKIFIEQEEIRRCNGTETRVGVAGKETDEKALLNAVLSKNAYERCKSARYRLIENKYLRLDDLSYINPRESVTWWAYRVRAGDDERTFKLEKTTGEYRYLQVPPSLEQHVTDCDGQENCSVSIGYYRGELINSSDWTRTGHDDVYVGVNGLLRKDTGNKTIVLYPPLMKEYQEIFSDSGESDDEAFIYKPDIHEKKGKPKEAEDEKDEKSKKNKTPIDDIKDWWSNIKGEWHLIKGILIGLFTFALLIGVVKLGVFIKSSFRKRRDDSIPEGKDEEIGIKMQSRRSRQNIYEEINEVSPTMTRRGRNIFN
ncbi:glycoprotein [Curionopolis virus]|uniref:G protein n=2 Tax=Curionopolis virus TaxID=490110 RepID=A0A068J4R3_9RHAB|nr:glycoprotein [Curionopolis virus]AIE12117.1 G protein [Curionopolis virus]AJR28364.1 glycoprotein [Curionopolis virus]